MKLTFSLDDINSVAKRILAENPRKIILFHGAMGVGKTTFIKALAKSLGVEEATSSPSFSLVNEYHSAEDEIVYHFDFYRLKTEIEALDMGVDDYLYSGNWCFIEWAEKIPNLIPEEHSVIKLEMISETKRSIELR
jgi:tRNA threonylcarbamoyladenosine biosynthesis protein TsaE